MYIGTISVVQLTYNTLATSLICQSTGGPATSVRWFQEGIEIDMRGTEFIADQIIVDTFLSIYNNILRFQNDNESNYVGSYSCLVENSRGNTSAAVDIFGELHNICRQNNKFTNFTFTII